MGLMNFFTSSIQAAVDSVKEGDVSGLMQGGLFGNKLIQDQKHAMQKLESRPKPGKLCHKLCPVNDMRCEACLSEQQNIIDTLENLEQIMEDLKEGKVSKAPDKCSLCGAPFEKGAKECPYCGTAYPKSRALADIPATEFERDKLLLEKSTETFALYSELYKKQIAYKAENTELPSFTRNMLKFTRSLEEKSMVMTPEQIKQGAENYGVSYVAYISGVMAGTYKSIPEINMEKQAEQLQQKSAEMTRQSQERNAQMLANQQARQQRAMQENAQRQAQMAASRSYGYNGGATRCCGTCRYYGAGMCCATGGKYEGRSRNASDDNCGWFALK